MASDILPCSKRPWMYTSKLEKAAACKSDSLQCTATSIPARITTMRNSKEKISLPNFGSSSWAKIWHGYVQMILVYPSLPNSTQWYIYIYVYTYIRILYIYIYLRPNRDVRRPDSTAFWAVFSLRGRRQIFFLDFKKHLLLAVPANQVHQAEKHLKGQLWTFRVTLGLDMCKVCTEAVHSVALWKRVTLGLGMCKVCTEAVRCVALWTRVTLGLGMCKVCTDAVHSVALWTRVTLGLGMCKVCTEAVHCVALWTRVTLGLGMCKVCTEAVHCVALWTRVTLGLGMCKVCTEAVHSVALWTRVTLGLGMCPCQVCTEARDATKNAKKKSPKAKTRPGKKGTKARKGCVSGSANVPVCGYIYMYVRIYTVLGSFVLGKDHLIKYIWVSLSTEATRM